MKFNIETLKIKQILSNVSKGIGNSKVNEILGGILIETNGKEIKFVSTDTVIRVEETVNYEAKAEESIIVDAGLFMGIVNQLNSNEICEIETLNNQISIKCGSVNVKQNYINGENYPTKRQLAKDTKQLKIKTVDFVNAINKAIMCCSKDDSRIILKGINISFENNNLVLCGCDGYKLSKSVINVLSATENSNNLNVTVPTKSLLAIQGIFSENDEIALTFDDRNLQVENGNTTISSTLYTDKYIDINRIIPADYKFSTIVSVSELKQALGLSLAVNKGSKTNIFNINIPSTNNENTIKIKSVSDSANSEVEINSEFDNNDIIDYNIYINTNYVFDMLKAISDEKIKIRFNGNTQPVIIENANVNGNYLFLILPVRVV